MIIVLWIVFSLGEPPMWKRGSQSFLTSSSSTTHSKQRSGLYLQIVIPRKPFHDETMHVCTKLHHELLQVPGA
eukprot:3422039-Heterocapsa_arctica.AAC.1